MMDHIGRLQMVSESDTGRCASKDVGHPREWIVRFQRE